MSPQANAPARASIRRHVGVGLLLVVFLVGGLGAWAAATEISGAVIALGSLVVDSNTKKVQHPSGGIVGEVRVRDGDRVKAGDVLVRLDDTITKANLAIIENGLTEQLARRARLEAERDGASDITLPHEFPAGSQAPAVERAMTGERRLFEMRRSSRAGQKDQLQQRIGQINDETKGLEAQVTAKAEEIVLIKRELAGARELWEKNLMPISKYTELQRGATRVEGERGQLVAYIAQAKGRASEVELQILQIDRELSSEVSKDLREAEARIAELAERKVAAEDQLRRIEVRAPQDGIVHQSTVHTVGGVVGAGEVIMLIVPETDSLVVEAKVAPQEIDQLRIGQKAALRFSAFNQQTTPQIMGTVNRISADITIDQRTGANYYTVRIATPREELLKLGGVKLIAGMPVEAFIETGERTVLSYLVKPMRDQISRAFRER